MRLRLNLRGFAGLRAGLAGAERRGAEGSMDSERGRDAVRGISRNFLHRQLLCAHAIVQGNCFNLWHVWGRRRRIRDASEQQPVWLIDV